MAISVPVIDGEGDTVGEGAAKPAVAVLVGCCGLAVGVAVRVCVAVTVAVAVGARVAVAVSVGVAVRVRVAVAVAVGVFVEVAVGVHVSVGGASVGVAAAAANSVAEGVPSCAARRMFELTGSETALLAVVCDESAGISLCSPEGACDDITGE